MFSFSRVTDARHRFGRPVLSGIAAVGLTMAMSGLVAAASAPPVTDAAVSPQAVAACTASQLSARIVDWQGAAGSRIADVQITNTSFVTCHLRNFPQVKMVSSKGTVLIKGSAASKTAAVKTLAPLKTLKTEVSASNYCGAAPAKPVTLLFALPGGAGSVVSIPLTPTDTSGLPPCFGAPGSAGHISMHAWHL